MTLIKKRWLTLFLSSFALFSLAACQVQEETSRFKMAEKSPIIEVTGNLKENKVTKHVYRMTLPYVAIPATNKAEAKEVLEPINANYNNLDGVEASLTYGQSEAKQVITIEPTKLNQEQLKHTDSDTSIFTYFDYHDYQGMKDRLTKVGCQETKK